MKSICSLTRLLGSLGSLKTHRMSSFIPTVFPACHPLQPAGWGPTRKAQAAQAWGPAGLLTPGRLGQTAFLRGFGSASPTLSWCLQEHKWLLLHPGGGGDHHARSLWASHSPEKPRPSPLRGLISRGRVRAEQPRPSLEALNLLLGAKGLERHRQVQKNSP